MSDAYMMLAVLFFALLALAAVVFVVIGRVSRAEREIRELRRKDAMKAYPPIGTAGVTRIERRSS